MSAAPNEILSLCRAHLASTRQPDVRGFVSGLLATLHEPGSLSASVADESEIVFTTKQQERTSFASPHAKSLLRTICARLAMIGSAESGRDFEPYGATYVLDRSDGHGTATKIRIEFMNTTRQQHFRLDG